MTDSIDIRAAAPGDLESLLPLMRGYCRDDGLIFDEARARVASRLLSEPQWGCVLLAEHDVSAIGYIALCVGFSIEMGGNDAFIDELYVEPEFRKRGLARRLLDAAESLARERGIAALHLEVDRDKRKVQDLYSSYGFERRERYFLMTKTLA